MRISPLRWISALMFLGIQHVAVAAAPSLNSLFPPGGQVGTHVTVKAQGNFDPWPVKVWVDRKDVIVHATSTKGELQFEIPHDATPGTVWIRLYNHQGATSLYPFFLGRLEEQVEVEPNDSATASQVIETGSVTINGRLGKAADVDQYTVPLQAGETMVASVEANRFLSSPMDAVLQVVSETGFVLQQNDDYHDRDPQIVFKAPEDSRYTVRIFSFPSSPNSTIGFSGSDRHIYRLTMTTESFVDHTYPLSVRHDQPSQVLLFGWNIPQGKEQSMIDPSNPIWAISDARFQFSPDGMVNPVELRTERHETVTEELLFDGIEDESKKGRLTPPVTVTGRIGIANEHDQYRFRSKVKQKLSFQLDSYALGYPLDPILRIKNDDQEILAEVDDTNGGRDAELIFDVPDEATYTVEVADRFGNGGFRYVYRLTVVPAIPDYRLRVATDHFQLQSKEALEIPITIERRHGFSEEIHISLSESLEGVEVTSGTSLPEGDSSKTVKLILKNVGNVVSGTFRIEGRVLRMGSNANARFAEAKLRGAAGYTPLLWLSSLVETQSQ